jgi:hypothetical protein
MKRTIQALAMLIAITLVAVWMVGCGGEEAGPSAELESVTPQSGDTIAGNATITIKLTNPVKADTKLQVNGVDATGSGKNWTWKSEPALPEGSATLTITWTNDDGSEGSATVTYTVTVPDLVAPKIVSSTPKDKATNLDPETLNTDGITITFDEPLKKVDIVVTVDDEPLKWSTAELSDDKKTATVTALAGGEVPYESEIVVVVNAEDLAGNKMDETTITINTKAKE